ncbi:MAG TPA: PQQ-binding-like beta-propeller repeat protein [Tepidisphaeraceae bacterium]|jgi:outer membrane protein assembly factor BamB
MRISANDLIYLGVRGYIIALDRHSGNEVWRATLKGYHFVNLVLDGDDLFASAQGEMFCLDRITGELKWSNPLRGMGYGLICIASPRNSQALFAEAHRQASEQAATAASSNASVTSS